MSEDEGKIRAIAFYLPQFHAIPENDEWWGKGFTEWTNVKNAKPLFFGHQQPHEPTDELGYYDLEHDPDIQEKQAQMAREHGIYGFCYYHYWFHGKKLLEKPLQRILESGKPDFPFCVCWANETWSRRWDGQDHEILIEQKFSPEDDVEYIKELIPYFKDKRYIRINGRPLLAVWRSEKLPDSQATIRIWQLEMEKAGLPRPYLVRIASHLGDVDPEEYGFDASVEFAPDWRNIGRMILEDGYENFPKIKSETAGFTDLKIFDYEATIENTLAKPLPSYKLFRGVFPSWDNTARRGEMGTVFINSTPENFEYFLRRQISNTLKSFAGEERLLFINAWNEWGEGCHLEPDKIHGKKYLEICKTLMSESNENILMSSAEDKQIMRLERHLQEKTRLEGILRGKADFNDRAMSEIEDLKREILVMKSSKFWKFRNMYLGLKAKLLTIRKT